MKEMNAVKIVNIEEFHKINGWAIASMANHVYQFRVGHTDFEWSEIAAINEAMNTVLYSELSHNDLVQYINIFNTYSGVGVENNVDIRCNNEEINDALYVLYEAYFYKKYAPVSTFEIWDTEYESTLPYGSLARPTARSSKRVRSVRRNSNKTFKKED